MSVIVKPCFGEPRVNVMNFLNEVVLDNPRAISFAPGRPAEAFFDVEGSLGEIERYVEHRCSTEGLERRAVVNDLGQYNKTNGIIQDLVAAQLAADEGIEVKPESIVITAGCQEAMTILLMALFEPDRDVLLSTDPTYIGITGLADILGVAVEPVAAGEEGIDLESLAEAIGEVRRQGHRPRALYDIPDFNNPLGTSLPAPKRRELLEVVHREGLLLFEDNPYGMFAYDGPPERTIKSLDTEGDVVYLGTFSKTLYPGLRVGYLVADQRVRLEPEGPETLLSTELSKVKSLTTVTTPPLLQAVVGGILLRCGGSLAGVMGQKVAFYRTNRDAMLASLERHLGGVAGVSWNRPRGGFFLTVEVPFAFDEECVGACARDHGVVCCPMSFFALSPGRERQVRLSFSYVTPEEIEAGVKGFAAFVKARAEAGP